MRDYWIIVDSDNIVVGTAEVKQGSLSEQEVLASHETGVNAFKVTEEIFNEQQHGEQFRGD